MKKNVLPFWKFPVLFLFVFSSLSCLSSLGGLLNKQKIIENRVLGLWNDGNMALIEDVYAPEAVVQASHVPSPIQGRESIENWIMSTRRAFPDLRMAFDDIIIKGDKVITRWTTTGTNTGPFTVQLFKMPPTGKKVRFSGISISRIVKGETVEETVVFNVAELYVQLGFKLVPPTSGK